MNFKEIKVENEFIDILPGLKPSVETRGINNGWNDVDFLINNDYISDKNSVYQVPMYFAADISVLRHDGWEWHDIKPNMNYRGHYYQNVASWFDWISYGNIWQVFLTYENNLLCLEGNFNDVNNMNYLQYFSYVLHIDSDKNCEVYI